jgi:hypothetical protein
MPAGLATPFAKLGSSSVLLAGGSGCMKGMVYVEKRKHEMKSTADEGLRNNYGRTESCAQTKKSSAFVYSHRSFRVAGRLIAYVM